MKRIAQMIRRRQRFVASIAAVVAMVVVVLFAFGEILGAQEKRVTLILCSHPGASRDFDGSLLNGDPQNGDLFATHPTEGAYRDAVNEGSTQSNLAWATYNYWSPLIEVSDEDIDLLVANEMLNDDTTVPCVLRAQFRINNRIAIAQYGPYVPVDRDGDGRVDIDANNWPLVSIRVWLNNTKVAEHETIPCEPGSDYELPGQSEPVPFQRPPGLTTPQNPVNPGGGGGGGGGVGGVPGEDDSNNGDTSSEDDSNNGDTSSEDDSDDGDTSGEDDSDNGDTSGKDDSDDGDSNNGGDSNGQEDSTEDGGTPGVGAGGTAADEDSATDDSEDQQQQDDADEQERDQEDSEESTSSQASADTEDTLETEDDTQSDDILEAEEESDTEAQDLMEQEAQAAEETDTQTAQVDEDNAQIGESGRPGPRVPGTGSGGVVDSKRDLSRQVVLGVSLGSAVTIALLLLGFNRRSSRRTG